MKATWREYDGARNIIFISFLFIKNKNMHKLKKYQAIIKSYDGSQLAFEKIEEVYLIRNIEVLKK